MIEYIFTVQNWTDALEKEAELLANLKDKVKSYYTICAICNNSKAIAKYYFKQYLDRVLLLFILVY